MKHLSYTQFKNIFGDWGITSWVKFNWLANGLPDGTYNGLTKVTIKSVTNINNNKRAYISGLTPIAPTDNNEVWQYGFCSLKTIQANASLEGVLYNNVSIDQNGFVFIQIPKIKQTVEAYNEYLSKNPVVLCFYDKNEWEGVKYNFAQVYSGGVRLYQQGRYFADFHMCDWRYVNLGYYKSPTDYPKPKAFTFFYYGAKESTAASLCVYPYDHAITSLSEVEQERLKQPVYFVFKK